MQAPFLWVVMLIDKLAVEVVTKTGAGTQTVKGKLNWQSINQCMKDMNDSSKYNIEKGILPFNSGNPINFLNFKKK